MLTSVDLDIESGTAAHYAAFVNRIRSHASGASKKYVGMQVKIQILFT